MADVCSKLLYIEFGILDAAVFLLSTEFTQDL